MPATLSFPCPACHAPTRVPVAFAGQSGACPRCRAQVEVPAGSQPLLPERDQTQVTPVTKPCLHCGEPVREAARKCRHCGGFFDARLRPREAGEGNYRLATAWDRLLAYLVDRVLLILPAWLLWMGPLIAMPSDSGWAIGLLGSFGWMSLVCAVQWILTTRTGATLGKRWRKIVVIRDDGAPVDFVHGVLLRSWIPVCMVVGGTLFFYVAGCLFLVVDKLFVLGDQRRCLHDHLASTLVVEQGHWAFPGVALPADAGQAGALR